MNIRLYLGFKSTIKINCEHRIEILYWSLVETHLDLKTNKITKSINLLKFWKPIGKSNMSTIRLDLRRTKA